RKHEFGRNSASPPILRRSEEAGNIKQENPNREGGQWFDLDWILSFFVLLDDQIARISRMKASIFFVIRARSGPRFCSRQIPLKNVTIKPARESLSSRDPRAAARLSMSNPSAPNSHSRP